MIDRPTYTLTLRPEPDPGDPDGIRRLRAALKRLLRCYGLRCIALAPEAMPTAADAPAGHAGDGNGVGRPDGPRVALTRLR